MTGPEIQRHLDKVSYFWRLSVTSNMKNTGVIFCAQLIARLIVKTTSADQTYTPNELSFLA